MRYCAIIMLVENGFKTLIFHHNNLLGQIIVYQNVYLRPLNLNVLIKNCFLASVISEKLIVVDKAGSVSC